MTEKERMEAWWWLLAREGRSLAYVCKQTRQHTGLVGAADLPVRGVGVAVAVGQVVDDERRGLALGGGVLFVILCKVR